MALTDIQTDQITLTPAAADAVQGMLKERDLEGYGLRIFIAGGGCSGYQYGMALENNFRESDLVLEQHGVKLVHRGPNSICFLPAPSADQALRDLPGLQPG